MEIKARESQSALQWLERSSLRLLTAVRGRTWVYATTLFVAMALAFVAGTQDGARWHVITTVKMLYELDLSGLGKYAQSKRASPRQMFIDIKHTDYQKLRFKREQALQRGRIITTDDSYVPAKVTVDGRSYRVRMRLKGDVTDHLEGEKLSFRIHVKGDQAIWGMKRFSIQHPKRSGWIKEWIMYAWFKYEDLISLRYDFVKVTINGLDLGVFALEESFGKELVEFNKRPEGPILKFDESRWFGEERTNRSQTDVYQTVDISSFNTSKTLGTEKLKNGFFAGRALLDQFRGRRKTLSEVMDVRRAARTFAILDILAAHHGTRWKNSRFYYNPITARLEFIGYNAYGPRVALSRSDRIAYQRWSGGPVGEYHVSEWIGTFFSDSQFVGEYFQALNRMSAPGYLENFFQSISVELEEKMNILYSEIGIYDVLYKRDGPLAQPTVEDYLENRELVYELLNSKLPLKAYLKHFDAESDQMVITIANTAFLPTQFEAVDCLATGKSYNNIAPMRLTGKTPGEPLQYADIEVHGFMPEDGICTLEVERSGDNLVVKGLRLRYKILGSAESRWANIDANPIELAWELFPRPPSAVATMARLVERGLLRIDDESHQIAILPGHWMITEDLVFPPGYRVTGAAATTLVLNNGAALISFSPLQLMGDPEAPFVVRSHDGTGQGIAVIAAGESSTLRHVVIKDQGSVVRGVWSLTGALTFYESDVTFANVRLENNRSEDMVNLVRSDYVIRDAHFVQSHSDALDVDFGDGVIENSSFSECGNDCIDVSSSITTIRGVDINGAGDKGVSVGEKSDVEIHDSRISKANVGVASKDSSEVDIQTLVISDAVKGLASYQKKPEFSGATLRARDVVIENTKIPFYAEPGSKILIDGKTVGLNYTP